MSACEICWGEASKRSRMLGGYTADIYRDLLAEHPRDHTPAAQPEQTEPTTGGGERG